MGIWAGIKYALNSTVGTKNMVPLDEQIANLKTLRASNNIYIELQGTGIENWRIDDASPLEEYLVPLSLTLLQSGSFKLKFTTNNTKAYKFDLKIYKNGVESKTISRQFDPGGEFEIVSDVLYFNRGDVLTFKFFAQDWRDSVSGSTLTSYLSISNLVILADLIDNVFLIEEVDA